MAGKSRSLSFVLLICALIGAALFYGCSGGGVSSDPIPARILQISGSVKSAVALTNIVYENNLLPGLRAQYSGAGVTVHLESDETKGSTTDNDGNYVIAGVPAGTHRVVARIKTLSGKTYKIRSAPIAVSETTPEVTVPQLDLKQADITVSGIIQKADNTPFANARITLWGESFLTDYNGRFTTPPMVEESAEPIIIVNTGYQTTTVNLLFRENAPLIEQIVVANAATNRAPSATLSANKYQVTKLYDVTLLAVGTDPDNDTLTYQWSQSPANAGVLTPDVSSGTRCAWIAPNADTVATITFTATDKAGLKAAASVKITVGRGVVVPNSPPTILSINVTPSTLTGSRDYQLTANATDSNSDALTYTWSATSNASAGVFLSNNASSITWRAPNVSTGTTTSVIITVTANDSKENGSVSLSRTLVVNPTVPNNIPVASIEIPAGTMVSNKKYTLTASATDVDGEALSYAWSIPAGKGTIYSPGSQQTEWLTPVLMATEAIQITLKVTDARSGQTTVTRSITVSSDPNVVAPTVKITSPSEKLFPASHTISFAGIASDSTGQTIDGVRMTWSETEEGKSQVLIASGSSSFSRFYTKPATYTIELKVLDRLGIPGYSTVSFRINATPTVSITKPLTGASLKLYSTITFEGTGSDVEDGTIQDSKYKWVFPAPAGILTGRTQTLSNLPAGTHTVELSVFDSLDAMSASASLQIYITDNSTPTVSITNPAAKTISQLNTTLTFTAVGADAEDGTISDSLYSWTFPAPVGAKTGATQTVSNLPAGTQTVYVSVADSHAAISEVASLQVFINQPPDLTNISPASGAPFLENTPISFSVSAIDTVGTVPDANIRWYKGTTLLGIGSSIQVSTLTVGLNAVTILASDSMGGLTATSTGVFINVPPTMTIISPANKSAVELNEAFTLKGSGSDTVGSVDTSTLQWFDYSLTNGTDSIIAGTGQNEFISTYTSSLDFGSHTITLAGTDMHGAAGSTSIEIFVNSLPKVTITSPVASGTRFNTASDVIFLANVIEDDPTDKLSINWYDGANPSTPLKTETNVTSSPSGKVFTFSTSILASGNHNIYCEMTDMHGLKAVASTAVFINTLPVAAINYTTAKFATGPNNRPIFLSTSPAMSIDFTASTFDVEIGGGIETYNTDYIRWFCTYKDVVSQVGTGTAYTAPIQLGISTITLQIFDSFYPAYEDNASASISLQVQVWQDRTYDLTNSTHLGMVVNDAADITGESSGFGANLIFSVQNPNRVVTAKFNGEFGADYFSDSVRFDTASTTMLKPFTETYAAAKVDGKINALGLSGNEILKEFTSTEMVGRASDTFVPLLTSARSMATDNTRVFISYPTLNKISLVNPANCEVTNTVTSANTVTFANPLKIRYSDQSYGKVFVADKGNDRIVRFASELLGTALQPLTVTAPEDAAFTKSYVLTINRSSGLVSVIDPIKVETAMTFGSSGTGLGQFLDARAIYCSGYDLFVLEANRLRVIRSGAGDWLK